MSDPVQPAPLRVAVYTSVFGGFESIWPPVTPDESFDYFVVTDRRTLSRFGTQILVRAEDFGSARLANRHHKMLFQETLSDFDYSIYLDANVRQVDSLAPLVHAFVESGKDLGLYPHYARNSVRAEMEACVARGKIDNPENARSEFAFYQSQGFTDTNGMWEGSVIIKNHRSAKLQRAMTEWWGLYSRFGTRDQFSLPFVIWNNRLDVYDLDRAPARRDDLFLRLPHASKGLRNKIARYVRGKAAESSSLRFASRQFGWKG
jgi:hypothetical protein